MNSLFEIFNNYKKVKKTFGLLIFFALLCEIVYLAVPKIVERTINVLETGQSKEQFFFYLSLLGVGFFLSPTLITIHEFFLSFLRWKLYAILNKKYRQKLLRINYANILETGTGTLMTRIENWINAESDIFMAIMNIGIFVGFRGIILITIFFTFIPYLALLFVAIFTILILVNNFIVKKVKKISQANDELNEQAGKSLSKMIMENLLIKIYNQQPRELETVEQLFLKIPITNAKRDIFNFFLFITGFFTSKFAEFCIYLVIWLQILNGENSISFLIMIITYLRFLDMPLDKAVNHIKIINQSLSTYNKLQDFINKPQEITNGNKKFQYKNGQIELKNIDFSYKENTPILRNLSITFLPGKVNALVGHSGGGKSTILRLILRLYDFKKGNILLDKQDIKNLDISSFYQYIGYLPQEPAIFDGTIRENLEFALTPEESNHYNEGIFWQALEKAQIREMIEKLPDKLNTQLGEKGIKLSGGEKQRLAIARIFLRDPQILILDEPTSALDSILENKITQVLNEAMRHRTVIVIAHRLQTVMNADNITVVEKWQAINSGNHQELLQSSPVYKKLVDLQHGKLIENSNEKRK